MAVAPRNTGKEAVKTAVRNCMFLSSIQRRKRKLHREYRYNTRKA